jgi:hypothetical protein
MSEHLCLPRRTAAEPGIAPQRKRFRLCAASTRENIRGWIVNIYWQQAFGSLFEELAATAETISRSANRK